MVWLDTRGIWVEWTREQRKQKGSKGERGNEVANEMRECECGWIQRAHQYGMRRRVNPDALARRRKLCRTALRLAASFPLLSTQPGMALHKEEREAGEQEVVAYPYEGA